MKLERFDTLSKKNKPTELVLRIVVTIFGVRDSEKVVMYKKYFFLCDLQTPWEIFERGLDRTRFSFFF